MPGDKQNPTANMQRDTMDEITLNSEMVKPASSDFNNLIQPIHCWEAEECTTTYEEDPSFSCLAKQKAQHCLEDVFAKRRMCADFCEDWGKKEPACWSPAMSVDTFSLSSWVSNADSDISEMMTYDPQVLSETIRKVCQQFVDQECNFEDGEEFLPRESTSVLSITSERSERPASAVSSSSNTTAINIFEKEGKESMDVLIPEAEPSSRLSTRSEDSRTSPSSPSSSSATSVISVVENTNKKEQDKTPVEHLWSFELQQVFAEPEVKPTMDDKDRVMEINLPPRLPEDDGETTKSTKRKLSLWRRCFRRRQRTKIGPVPLIPHETTPTNKVQKQMRTSSSSQSEDSREKETFKETEEKTRNAFCAFFCNIFSKDKKKTEKRKKTEAWTKSFPLC